MKSTVHTHAGDDRFASLAVVVPGHHNQEGKDLLHHHFLDQDFPVADHDGDDSEKL